MIKIMCDFCGKEIKKGYSISLWVKWDGSGDALEEYEIHDKDCREDCFKRVTSSLAALFPFHEE